MIDGSVPIGIMDSLTMSGIGIFVVFMELILLAICINLISRVIRMVSPKEAPVAAVSSPAPARQGPNSGVTPPARQGPNSGVTPPARQGLGSPASVPPVPLTLMDVDEPTAATVMAVVSHQSRIPLNRLAFRSIKGQVALEGVEERDAAVVMALCAHQLKKPVNKLCFKSVRYVGEAPAVEPTPPQKPAAAKPVAEKPPAAKSSVVTAKKPAAKSSAATAKKTAAKKPAAKKPAPQRPGSAATAPVPKKTTK